MNRVFRKTYKVETSNILSRLSVSHLERIKMKNLSIRKHSVAAFVNDHIGIHLNAYPYYEYNELKLMFDFLIQEDCNLKDGSAIDIGANIGNHSIFFSDYFLDVHSFEINPNTFQLLKFNTQNIRNIFCYNIGLSDKQEYCYFKQNDLNIGASRIVSDYAENSIRLNLESLDDHADKFQNIKLIKIDVEGHELKALKGTAKTLLLHKPMVLFELIDSDFIDGVPEILTYLESFEYAFYIIRPKKKSFIWKALNLLLQFVTRSRREELIEVRSYEIKPNFYHMVLAINKSK